MSKILPDPTQYRNNAIVIGYDGRWYQLNSKKLWVVLKNSPTKSQIENRIKKLKIRSIDNLIQIMAFYVDPIDKQRYIDNAWGSVQYGTAYACYLILRILDHYGYDPLQYLNLKIQLGKSTSINTVKNQIIKREIK